MSRLSLAIPHKADFASSIVRGDGREADIVNFEKSVLGFFADTADLLGVPKSVAILYGIIFATPEPLSFAEIEKRLFLSKGSISQGLRVLRETGAIKEVSTSTERVERFAPDMEMRQLIQRFLEYRLEKQLDVGTTRLSTIHRHLPDLARTQTEILSNRLKQLQQWHSKAISVLPVARTLLKLTSA